MRILTDKDVERLPLAPLIAAVRRQIIADAMGEAVAPPRHFVDFANGSLVFTIGGDARLAGFRAYQTFAKPGHPYDDQIIAAWDRQTGEMLGLAIGNKLGALRTGAIGAVAADLLAPGNARILTIVGTGRQAETQLLAVSTVRAFDELRVVGRRRDSTAAFAERLGARIGKTMLPFTDARAALDGADIVVLATTAEQPVIEAGWLQSHAYVASIGPKSRDMHELPLELADRARVIATDSPQQIARMGDSHMLFGQPAYDRVQHLGEFAAHGSPPVQGPALFLSIGLAGTEVSCLAAALEYLPA